MRIISEKTIRKFWLKNRDAEMAMREWMTAVRQTDWQSFADVRQTFNHADVYKNAQFLMSAETNTGLSQKSIIENIRFLSALF
jgi:mRNA interferase HigB